MQRPEDRPPKTGRPSLLSAEQQAEADRHRILSTLDGKAVVADKGAPAQAKKRRPMLLWGTAGAGLIAAAGALVWMNNELDDKTASMSAAVLPAPSAAPAPAAPAAAATTAAAASAASSAPAEPEVSTAAILDDTPAAAPEARLPSLNEMLSAPSPSTHKEQKTAQLAEQKTEHKGAHKPEHAHKAEQKAEPVRLAQKSPPPEHKPKAAEKPRYKPVPAPAPDSDVTLLAALMAHMQTPSKKADSPAAQLKLCKQQNAAGEEQCRARLCAGAARNEAECKSPPIAKASSDS